jgi:hypothetical protein
MDVTDAYNHLDLLLDKADQPYFTNLEKNLFLELAVTEYIDKHYTVFGANQEYRDKLNHLIVIQNDPGFGVLTLPSDYLHLLSVTVGGKNYKVVNTNDYFDKVKMGASGVATEDPFNDPNKTPIATVVGDGSDIKMRYFPIVNGTIRAEGFVNVTSGAITSINMTNFGLGYATAPTLTIDTANGTGATFGPLIIDDTQVVHVPITNGGTNYVDGELVVFTGPAGSAPDNVTYTYLRRPGLTQVFDNNYLSLNGQHQILKIATRMLTANIESSNYEVQTRETE